MSSMKIFVFSVLAAFIGAASALVMRELLAEPAQPQAATPGQGLDLFPAAPPNTKAAEAQDMFSAAIQRSMPAVVLITAQRVVGVVSPYFDLNNYRRRIDYMEVPSGQGSGFFIRKDGYILTNYHVVRGQDSFWITTHDGGEFPAQVVGIDPPTDLALLKVKSDKKVSFPVLEFADPEKLQIGHWAIAIGAPFSLSRTVTIGIVSNKKRNGVGVNLHENYVQTDASVNPGNSGGPLLDIHGRVIGVNDFILSPSGGNIGLSFAISSEIAKRVAHELIANGHVERPWLGVTLAPLDREMKRKYDLPHGGVIIAQIFRGSPAAGVLRPGDIVIKANGKEIASPSDLQGCIFGARVGSVIEMEVLRSGSVRKVKVTVEKSPSALFSGNFRQEERPVGY